MATTAGSFAHNLFESATPLRSKTAVRRGYFDCFEIALISTGHKQSQFFSKIMNFISYYKFYLDISPVLSLTRKFRFAIIVQENSFSIKNVHKRDRREPCV